MDSVWVINEELTVLRREYPELFRSRDETSDDLLETCALECTEAT